MLEAFYQELIKTQADVVYGVQDKRKGGFFEKVFGGLFYRFFNFLSDVNMPPNLLMARLMTRGYVDAPTTVSACTRAMWLSYMTTSCTTSPFW